MSNEIKNTGTKPEDKKVVESKESINLVAGATKKEVSKNKLVDKEKNVIEEDNPYANMTAIESFILVQHSMQVGKNRYNAFSKFNYRSVEDIMYAWKKLAVPNLCLTLTDKIIEVGGRVFVEAYAFVTDVNDNLIRSVTAQAELGESGRKGMSSEQNTGSASSYARKYALNGLFLLDDTEDVDSLDNTAKSKARGKGKSSTPALEDDVEVQVTKRSELQALYRGHPERTKKTQELLAGRHLLKLTSDELQEILDEVKKIK